MRSFSALALLPFALAAQQPAAAPAAPAALPTITAKLTGLERRDGFFPLVFNERTGTLWMELPRDGARALLFPTLATGLGSNPIGLDRGANGIEQVTRFDRRGDKVLVIFENWSYRSSGGMDHRRTVDESFPPSTVAALPLLAEENGRLLVDVTEFVMRDWVNIGAALQQSQEGSYAVARDRSTIHAPYTKVFPLNTEIDVALTFATTGAPGRIVSSIAPDGKAITLRQHLSFLQLPDDRFRPREIDPRVGFFGISFKDYAQPIQGQLTQEWAARHRLLRANPNDARSPITTPLVYYIDRGIPEPLRTATFEGVSFWVEAFNKAGLTGGFKVEYLPEGVDPMDARYNIVQWENRNERGWSIGGALTDPRTGEMIKAMARMDSHRARTDYNIFAAFLGAAATSADTAFVLARVRQVSAHEVGHTLGLQHNYIASSYERGSVMDYPAPRIRVTNGAIDVSQAYAKGPGPYDIWAIRWGYGVYPPASEADTLRAIVADGLRRGYLYLSDASARPEGASDPRSNLWDDAATAPDFLRHQMDARRIALQRFGLRNIRDGESLEILQDRFPLLYFFHRFALNGVTKTIGGMEYSNAVKGDGQFATRLVPPARQRAALQQLLGALSPAELAIPDTVLALFVPRFDGGNIELVGTRTAPAFDELSAARTLAQMIVNGILQPQRAARLVAFGPRLTNPLTLGETIDALIDATWKATVPTSAKEAALLRVTQRAVADGMMTLAADKNAAPEVRALVDFKLRELGALAGTAGASGALDARAHAWAVAGDIERWLTRKELPTPSSALRAPPGDPFGDDGWNWLP
ncbi:MAG: zinc-dependent metalloprotease [Gemmatimonadaceae bacterium]|nr:zinc-dependent metalloprotease [Gemmatimonadaceae bacterium]